MAWNLPSSQAKGTWSTKFPYARASGNIAAKVPLVCAKVRVRRGT